MADVSGLVDRVLDLLAQPIPIDSEDPSAARIERRQEKLLRELVQTHLSAQRVSFLLEAEADGTEPAGGDLSSLLAEEQELGDRVAAARAELQELARLCQATQRVNLPGVTSSLVGNGTPLVQELRAAEGIASVILRKEAAATPNRKRGRPDPGGPHPPAELPPFREAATDLVAAARALGVGGGVRS